jgi:GNAT superfamily N-acetyltransferase
VSAEALRIEPAAVHDSPAISALILSLSEPFFTSPTREGAEPFLASVSAEAEASYLADARFAFWVARHGDTLAGFVALRDGSHLFHLFVAQAFQRQGLARRLWLHALRELPAVARHTVNASLNAVPVYERLGFRATGAAQHQHGIAFVPMMREGAAG